MSRAHAGATHMPVSLQIGFSLYFCTETLLFFDDGDAVSRKLSRLRNRSEGIGYCYTKTWSNGRCSSGSAYPYGLADSSLSLRNDGYIPISVPTKIYYKLISMFFIPVVCQITNF